MRFTRSVAIAVLAGCCGGCGGGGQGATPEQRSNAREAPTPGAAPRETILRNMPTNSEQRCVGISVVTEALLDGKPAEGNDLEAAEDVAQRIYRGLVTRQPLRYHARVLVGAAAVSIESPTAIEKLGSLVTDFYKQDFLRLSETEEGQQQLLSAEDSFVTTDMELDRILEAEPDRTDAFFGSGSRTFPDGTLETTHHVFLIGKQADGNTYVYDSNDPGLPITCKLVNRREGVEVEWTCKYRDTGKETTQRYLVVPKDTFFRLMLAE